MAGALSGLLGGVHNRDLSIDTPAAAMRVHAPAVLRNGEFFEFRVQITARRDIAEPVIAISAPYWRDVTINPMAPPPAEETFSGDAIHFTYKAGKAGERPEKQIDGPINPERKAASRVIESRPDGNRPGAKPPKDTK